MISLTRRYPYEAYGARGEGRRAVKMQKLGLDTRAKAPSLGAARAFKRTSRHEFEHLFGNVGAAPVGVA